MATEEEDNFDIDIYGDGDGGQGYDDEAQANESAETTKQEEQSELGNIKSETDYMTPHSEQTDLPQQIDSTDQQGQDSVQIHKQAPQTQGLKREGGDDRPLGPGATAALFLSDIPWWITDDDIRGWTNQGGCEDELEEITFSEHKVNGKSKGQSYVLLSTAQAATATKHIIESFGEGQKYKQKLTASFTNPYTNPFKSLPKDGNMRNSIQSNRSTSGGYNAGAAIGAPAAGGYNQVGFRGGRGGGYNNRGGYNRGGYQQPGAGSFQGGNMNGFQRGGMGGMGGMQHYGGFQNRGGMMAGMGNNMIMRGGGGGGGGGVGGRGGMGNPMMIMPMGGMMGGMGAMGGQMPNMVMPQMGVGMGMQGAGFQNPAFFAHQHETWNPHGAKRTRQE